MNMIPFLSVLLRVETETVHQGGRRVNKV